MAKEKIMTTESAQEFSFASIQDILSFNKDLDDLSVASSQFKNPFPKAQALCVAKNSKKDWRYNWQTSSFPKIVFFEFARQEDFSGLAVKDFTVSTVNSRQLSHYSYSYSSDKTVYILVSTTLDDGHDIVVNVPFVIAQNKLGLKITADMKLQIGDVVRDFPNWRKCLDDIARYYRDDSSFDYTISSLADMCWSKFGGYLTEESIGNLLKAAAESGWPAKEVKTSGIAKVLAKSVPYFAELQKERPIEFCFMRSLMELTPRTIDGVRVSAIFNETFKDVQSKDDLLKIIRSLWKSRDSESHDDEDGDEEASTVTDYSRIYPESALRALPLWKEKRKAVLKSQGHRAFTKILQEFDSLNLDEKKYPKTAKAIKAGDLPLTTFFRKQEQYYLLNDAWELWEKMLAKHYDITIEIAKEVKGRTTYEKDLMSYFYFLLYSLPKYLQKYTGKKWTCIPKLVDSASELEPPEEEGGVARKRSALTPIVDNKACTVEVPYASLAIGGSYGTTYCYSHDYHLLTTGFSFKGNVVTKELEEKLNGKDDYGLMFYTLTGSFQGRGYPTFLIIFERKKDDTTVHFHRTHPSRSKDGDYNSIHNWTRVCYNWMAGNINKSLIKAQQGDLVFVESDKEVVYTTTVDSYDKHRFERPVSFAEGSSERSSNILCYVNLAEDTLLMHTEHENTLIPKGKYAIHQCRSWEANPKGVWSLRID